MLSSQYLLRVSATNLLNNCKAHQHTFASDTMLHSVGTIQNANLFLDRFAGFIMTAAMNLLLMIFVALDPMPKHHDSHGVLLTPQSFVNK